MSHPFSLSPFVKQVAIAAVLASTWLAAPAFAADTADQQTAPQTQAQVHQKTRAEVYQELVDAEKSGELARLNALYSGG